MENYRGFIICTSVEDLDSIKTSKSGENLADIHVYSDNLVISTGYSVDAVRKFMNEDERNKIITDVSKKTVDFYINNHK